MNEKKVKLNLEGLDGNAFALMGAFQRAARNQGWIKSEIEKVLNKCTNGNYDNLICTLIDNTEREEDE